MDHTSCFYMVDEVDKGQPPIALGRNIYIYAGPGKADIMGLYFRGFEDNPRGLVRPRRPDKNENIYENNKNRRNRPLWGRSAVFLFEILHIPRTADSWGEYKRKEWRRLRLKPTLRLSDSGMTRCRMRATSLRLTLTRFSRTCITARSKSTQSHLIPHVSPRRIDCAFRQLQG